MGSDHGFAFMVVYFALTSHCICWNKQNISHGFSIMNTTRNNQRLRSAGDNDQKSKRFCSSAVLCLSFTWEMVKTRKIRLGVIESANARDQSAFCAFHTLLVDVQTNAGHIHATHAHNLEIRIAGSSCRLQLNNFYFHHIWIFPKCIIRWDD